uniref:Uncharacterized protein n=1 Tax=Romanomermis culicivorax TaxID=13658 RepID=A0A915JE80_ROMCU
MVNMAGKTVKIAIMLKVKSMFSIREIGVEKSLKKIQKQTFQQHFDTNIRLDVIPKSLFKFLTCKQKSRKAGTQSIVPAE